jgi:hypothetical protein
VTITLGHKHDTDSETARVAQLLKDEAQNNFEIYHHELGCRGYQNMTLD